MGVIWLACAGGEFGNGGDDLGGDGQDGRHNTGQVFGGGFQAIAGDLDHCLVGLFFGGSFNQGFRQFGQVQSNYHQ